MPETRTPALDGIRILDFTSVMSGPTCSMLLADLGADVLKVEPPAGDESRRWGRFHFGPGDQFSGLFSALNRNKASIVLDLKTADGQDALTRLLPEVDVIVENFKPGVTKRLGIDYERVGEFQRSSQRTGHDDRHHPSDEPLEASAWQVQH